MFPSSLSLSYPGVTRDWSFYPECIGLHRRAGFSSRSSQCGSWRIRRAEHVLQILNLKSSYITSRRTRASCDFTPIRLKIKHNMFHFLPLHGKNKGAEKDGDWIVDSDQSQLLHLIVTQRFLQTSLKQSWLRIKTAFYPVTPQLLSSWGSFFFFSPAHRSREEVWHLLLEVIVNVRHYSQTWWS